METKTKTRKCTECGENVVISFDNISEIIIYNKACFHKQCFLNKANRIANKNVASSQAWKDALNNIDLHERETKNIIEHKLYMDALNEFILNGYDIITSPSRRFWSMVNELSNGYYRNKRCKPVDTKLLLEAWQWGKDKLDNIAEYNRLHGKTMYGERRIYYDLSIILNKLPLYLKEKQEAERKQDDMNANIDFDEVDMSRIGKTIQSERRDISDISDDIFVE